MSYFSKPFELIKWERVRNKKAPEKRVRQLRTISISGRLKDAHELINSAFVAASPPTRFLDPDSIRVVLAAIELNECAKLSYQSMTSPTAGERVISPHSLVKASGRWHVRAFDYQRIAFVDFSLSRIAAPSPTDEKSAVPCDLDSDWHSLVDVEFIPHPELSSDQTKMVASEFGMVKGRVTVSIRRALLFYLLDEMHLLTAVMRSDPELAKGTTLWIRNTEAVARELAGAKMKQAWPKT